MAAVMTSGDGDDSDGDGGDEGMRTWFPSRGFKMLVMMG